MNHITTSQDCQSAEALLETSLKLSTNCPTIDKDLLINCIKELPLNKANPSIKIPNEALIYGGSVLHNVLFVL